MGKKLQVLDQLPAIEVQKAVFTNLYLRLNLLEKVILKAKKKPHDSSVVS